MANLHVKKGDLVEVLVGDVNEKGKRAKITAASPKTGKIVLENLFLVKRAVKPRSAQQQGGLVDKPRAIDASNVMLVCPKCDKATRVGHQVVDNHTVRICKKCGAVVDTKAAKAETKTATKAKKTSVAKEEVNAAPKAKKSTKAKAE